MVLKFFHSQGIMSLWLIVKLKVPLIYLSYAWNRKRSFGMQRKNPWKLSSRPLCRLKSSKKSISMKSLRLFLMFCSVLSWENLITLSFRKIQRVWHSFILSMCSWQKIRESFRLFSCKEPPTTEPDLVCGYWI